MSNGWRHRPTINLPSPVLALLATSERLWAGGLGGLVTSSDERDWSPGGKGLPLDSVTALAAAEGVLFAGGEGGLARSANGGRTWLPCLFPDPGAIVSDIALSPRFGEDGMAVAATLADGVIRSADEGRSWQRSSFGLESSEVLALKWGVGETVIAATGAGLYRSPNAGRAWQAVEPTAAGAIVGLASLVSGEIIAAPLAGPPLRSSQDLAMWTPLTGLPADIQTSSILAIGRATILLGTADRGLMQSADGGATWQPVSPERVLTLHAVGERIYAGTDCGVMMSQDEGRTWRALPSPPLHDLHRLSIVSGAPLAWGRNSPPVILGAEGMWTALRHAPAPLTGLFVTPDDALMTATPEGLFRSEDLGNTWSQVVAGETAAVTQMTYLDREQGWAGGGQADLLRTRDGGRIWDGLGAPYGVLPLVALQALPAAPGRDTVSLIAATYDERRHAVSLWRSDDGGEHWGRGADSFTHWPVVATNDEPPAIAIGNTITVRQADGSWQQAVVADGGVRRVVGSGRLLLAVTGDSLWRSEDGGASWARSDLDLPVEEVLDVALDGDVLYVLLAGGRVWSRGFR